MIVTFFNHFPNLQVSSHFLEISKFTMHLLLHLLLFFRFSLILYFYWLLFFIDSSQICIYESLINHTCFKLLVITFQCQAFGCVSKVIPVFVVEFSFLKFNYHYLVFANSILLLFQFDCSSCFVLFPAFVWT